MNPKHQQKIDELITSIATNLKATAHQLYLSGAVDVERFDPNHYGLAKLLVTAAMHSHKDDFILPFQLYKNNLENLMHF